MALRALTWSSIGTLLWLSEGYAATAPCTAAGIAAIEPACPDDPAQPCQIRSVVEAESKTDCLLDLSGRDLVIGSADGPGGTFRAYGVIGIHARSLTVHANGAIVARNSSEGSSLAIEVSESVTVLSKGVQLGAIDVSALHDTASDSALVIRAGGTVSIDGIVSGSTSDDVYLYDDVVIHAVGDFVGAGKLLVPAGYVRIDARRVDFTGTLDLTGTENPGAVFVDGDVGVKLRDVLAAAVGAYPTPDGIWIKSNGDVVLDGTLDFRALGPGDYINEAEAIGGVVDVRSGGSISIANARTGADAVYGFAGRIILFAGTDITLGNGKRLGSSADNLGGAGGRIELTAGRDILLRGEVDVSAGAFAGDVTIRAGRHVVIEDLIDAGTPSRDTSGYSGPVGGDVNIYAGSEHNETEGQEQHPSGNLTFNGRIYASGGGCTRVRTIGGYGSVAFEGCDLTLGPLSSIEVCGVSGGEIYLKARRQVKIAGALDATRVSTLGSPGKIYIDHREGFVPDVSKADIAPAAQFTSYATCTDSMQSGCLLPCPECGNGVIEFPETCDSLVNCDGCFECFGDINGDGGVGWTDIHIATGVINQCRGVIQACSPVPGSLSRADFGRDGLLSASDLARMFANLRSWTPPPGCQW